MYILLDPFFFDDPPKNPWIPWNAKCPYFFKATKNPEKKKKKQQQLVAGKKSGHQRLSIGFRDFLGENPDLQRPL